MMTPDTAVHDGQRPAPVRARTGQSRSLASANANWSDSDASPSPEALRRTVAGVLIEFVRAVEPREFCCFVFILAYGNLTRAAEALGMVRRTLDRQVKAWAWRGPIYRRMLRLIPGRNVGRSPELVSLGMPVDVAAQRDQDQSETEAEAEPPQTVWEQLARTRAIDSEEDYPALLGDVRGALEGMNEQNWRTVRGELLTLLSEEKCPRD